MGQILTYNGKPISAVYSHSNGGTTRSSKEVWGNEYPYLIAQADPWDKETKNGHGVGMSQAGAINAAKWGKNYKEILNFYYPGAKLTLSRPAVFE
jgi:peptidoglycan hydrolase-like amidase